MKKHLLALAALATVSGAAVAQSATVYGIFDLSVARVGDTTSTNGNTTALADAVWMPSVFGITGSEDLGGGLKATFNLESDVNVDSGSLSAASSTGASATGSQKLFGRKANVGLSSANYGSVTLGKDIDMIFLQGFIDNVRNSHSASGFVAHTLATDLRLDTESVFIQNMVRYTTPTWNGLKASVQHRFGETAGNTGLDASTAYLVNYSVAGLSLSAATKEMTSSTAVKTELTYLGATYSVGAFRFAATHHQTKYKSAGTPAIKTNEVGAAYSVSPKLTAAVNYVKIDRVAANTDSSITSASLKYSLSKRTSLWTLVSKSNSDSGVTATNDAGYAARPIYSVLNTAGKDSTAYAVGITHSF